MVTKVSYLSQFLHPSKSFHIPIPLNFSKKQIKTLGISLCFLPVPSFPSLVIAEREGLHSVF